VDKSSVLENLEDAPPRREPWTLWIILALVLSIGAHLAFAWWARTYAVKTFSDSYYEQMVPRAFKVDRVEIDSRLLDEENPAPAAETQRKITPAPVDLPAEDISAEKAEVRAAPAKPGQLGIDKEPAPEIGLAASDAAARLEAATTAALEEDLASMREALLADTPSSAAQPAIELAAAAGRAGAEGADSVPAGYSDLDDLLAQTGGLTAAAGPIFMPSDVLFGYDESFLRPEAITSLEKLGELIRRNPEARFRIEGHTDSFGGADYNTQLSLARADSVKRWLAETMSIDPARIDTRGLGSTRPLAPATGTVEEQQLNRRVEIVILRADGGR
jgi:outer membrane protein OmpA-like peptidoglycan-associated protein